MKRFWASLLVTLAVSGLLVAASPTAATASSAVYTCNTRTSNSSTPNGWHFISPASYWRLGPLAANPSCGGYVTMRSNGWRFDGTACGQFWLRRPLPGGGTYIVPGSLKHLCGGETEVIVSRCTCAHFWLEAWPDLRTDRHNGIWPLGTASY